jgi:hypothetical protein
VRVALGDGYEWACDRHVRSRNALIHRWFGTRTVGVAVDAAPLGRPGELEAIGISCVAR